MSVCAVMLVKDEIDVIGHNVEYLLGQVDQVIVCDNGSTDGTLELIQGMSVETIRDEAHRGIEWAVDPDPAYYQARKMTALAAKAYEYGHDWVLPVDADEFWRCGDTSTRIADLLADLPEQVRFVAADLYDHKATSLDDPDEPNPAKRMPWRFREPVPLPKIACRTAVSLRIGMGNHEATAKTPALVHSSGAPWPTLRDALVVEHYGWRSREQLVKKIANGYRAYAATEGLDAYGGHWKAFGRPDEPQFGVRVSAWFDAWAWTDNPYDDAEIGRFPWWPEA